MFIDQETLYEVNIAYEYKGFSKLDTPEIRARAGVIEVPDPLPPEDIRADVQANPDHYTVNPTGDGSPPYKLWTRKSDAQIKEAHNAKVWVKIDAVERAAMFPRQLRDFLLEQPGANGKPWFAKIKSVDDEVVTLKATLLP